MIRNGRNRIVRVDPAPMRVTLDAQGGKLGFGNDGYLRRGNPGGRDLIRIPHLCSPQMQFQADPKDFAPTRKESKAAKQERQAEYEANAQPAQKPPPPMTMRATTPKAATKPKATRPATSAIKPATQTTKPKKRKSSDES